jgi:hypothetical protein
MREQGVFCGASGMDVLERIWAIEDAGCELTGGEDDVAGLPLLSSLGGQASRWNKAMSMALPLTNINMNIPMEAMPMPSMPMSAASVSASWGMHDLAAFVWFAIEFGCTFHDLLNDLMARCWGFSFHHLYSMHPLSHSLWALY